MQNGLFQNTEIVSFIVKTIQKNLLFIIAFFCIGTLVGYTITRLLPKEYSVSLTLLIDKDDKSSVNQIFRAQNLSLNTGSSVENEVILLKSKNIITQGVRKSNFNIAYYYYNNLGLIRACAANPFIFKPIRSKKQILNQKLKIEVLNESEYEISYELDGVNYNWLDSTNIFNETISSSETKKCEFNSPASLQYLSFQIDKKPYTTIPQGVYYVEMIPTEKITYTIRSGLHVANYSNNSTVVKINLIHQNTEQASLLLDSIAASYIDSDVQNKQQQYKKKIEFIDGRINELISELQSSEIRLEKFQVEKRSIDLEYTSKKIYDLLIDKQAEKEIQEIKLSYYNYVDEYVNSNNVEDIMIPSFSGVEDDILNKQVNSLTELNLHFKEAKTKYSPNNPIYTDIKQKVLFTSKSINDILSKYITTTELRIKEINESIESIEAEVIDLPAAQRELINIKRKFDVKNGVYTFLLERRAEANIQLAATSSNKTIIDKAGLDQISPIKPNKKLIIGLCIILFTGGFFSFLFIKSIIHPKVSDVEDVKAIQDKIPFLGEISQVNKKDLISDTLVNPKSLVFESFREIRSNLDFVIQQDYPAVIGITSYIPTDGKSFVSKNLSRTYSLYGKKALWVNCDLRKEDKLNPGLGLSNYLSGQCELKEILQEHVYGTNVINSGNLPPNPSELLSSQKMSQFINEVKERFEYIFIDFPPTALISDWKTVNKLLDRTIYVVRHEHSHIKSLEAIQSEKGSSKICTLYNGSKNNLKKSYGYYNYQ